MLALPAWFSALAGASVVVGLRLLLPPLLDPRVWYWRALLLGGAMLLAWRYMIWRFTDTVAPLGWTADALFSWGFAILEALTVLSSTIAFFILSRVKERSHEADRHSGWWKPARPGAAGSTSGRCRSSTTSGPVTTPTPATDWTSTVGTHWCTRHGPCAHG